MDKIKGREENTREIRNYHSLNCAQDVGGILLDEMWRSKQGKGMDWGPWSWRED